MAQYALLVGVGCFQNNISPVDFVIEDVSGFSDVLMNNMDVPYENIVELINEAATQSAIQSSVESICDKVVEGDRVILYFSTHGKSFNGTSFLAAYDASDDNNCNDGWVWVSNLITLLHNHKCNILAFLDSCHSTQFSRAHGSSSELEPITPISDVQGQYKALFGAAGEHEEAYSDTFFGHGCWSFYLLEALSGRAPRAFSDGSRRITANSLQTYLCESVSARQREFGRCQTPYLDAVYPSDILIVDFPEREGKTMKVKDIYFGEIDADSEKNNVPSTEFMVKNFFDLNSISSKLSTNNGIQVIIGNKGTGKTYLGEYLEASNDNTIFETVKTISFNDIQNLTSAQADERGKYVQAWTFALYSILACFIVNQKRTGADEFYTLLRGIYGNQIDLILNSLSAGKKWPIVK